MNLAKSRLSHITKVMNIIIILLDYLSIWSIEILDIILACLFKRDLIGNLRRCHVFFLAGEPDSWIPTPQLAAGKERERKGKGMRFKDRAKKRWIKKKPRVKTIVDRPKGNTTKSSATRLKVCVYMRYETVSLDKVFYRGRVAPNNICCQLSKIILSYL